MWHTRQLGSTHMPPAGLQLQPRAPPPLLWGSPIFSGNCQFAFCAATGASGRPPLGPSNLWDSAELRPHAREARRLHHEWP
jgi:hypothetical protein